MSSIRSTITSALNDAGHGQYLGYAEGVISALEAREESIVDTLTNIATSKGVSEVETRTILEAAGLLEPEPEVEDFEDEGEEESTGFAEVAQEVLAEVRSLRAEVGALKAAAQRHGVSV